MSNLVSEQTLAREALVSLAFKHKLKTEHYSTPYRFRIVVLNKFCIVFVFQKRTIRISLLRATCLHCCPANSAKALKLKVLTVTMLNCQ